jgi:predicted transcriptional regulator
MTLDDVKKKLNLKNDYEVADTLGISQQAVSLWRSKGGAIPALRQYQIKDKIDAIQV